MRRTRSRRTRPRIIADSGGVTLPELLIGIVVLSVAAAFSSRGLVQYREVTATNRAARAVMSDVTMARSLAIRTRSPISLVSRDSLRTYVIRDTTGAIMHRRELDDDSELPLTSMDVATPGDSLTFDARGILITTGTVQVDLSRGARTRTVAFNAMGRGVVY